ncbi:unnamed protein product, partial [Sphacelaria rigidula]
VHAGFGKTFLGVPTNSSSCLQEAAAVAASLDQSGLDVSLEYDMERILWEKLAVNASINGLTALLECRNGDITETSYGRELVGTLCGEVRKVAEAANVRVPNDLLSNVLSVIGQNAGNISSMHMDIASKRRTEIDYINGFVVKHGALLQVPTPVNRTIYDLVKMKEGIRL